MGAFQRQIAFEEALGGNHQTGKQEREGNALPGAGESGKGRRWRCGREKEKRRQNKFFSWIEWGSEVGQRSKEEL